MVDWKQSTWLFFIGWFLFTVCELIHYCSVISLQCVLLCLLHRTLSVDGCVVPGAPRDLDSQGRGDGHPAHGRAHTHTPWRTVALSVLRSDGIPSRGFFQDAGRRSFKVQTPKNDSTTLRPSQRPYGVEGVVAGEEVGRRLLRGRGSPPLSIPAHGEGDGVLSRPFNPWTDPHTHNQSIASEPPPLPHKACPRITGNNLITQMCFHWERTQTPFDIVP